MTPSFIDSRDGQVRPGSDAAGLVERLIAGAHGDASALLFRLRAHGVPAAAVAQLVEHRHPDVALSEAWMARVADDRARGDRYARAAELTEEALAPVLGEVAMLVPALGPVWSSDVDVLISKAAMRRAAEALCAAGFLDVNPLLVRIGRVTPGVERFGAVEGNRVLGAVELCRDLYDYGPSADPAVARALPRAPGGIGCVASIDLVRRRAGKIAAARRIRLRAVLELMAVTEELVTDTPLGGIVGIALRRSIEFEQELGAIPTVPSPPAFAWRPNIPWLVARVRAVRREARHRGRPRRVRVVFSGIDGAGKSTQVDRLNEHLDRLNVPSVPVWVRLGFSGSALLSGVARLGQLVLPAGSHSAHQARATATGNPTPTTRRGLVGWVWALAVTLEYVWQSWAAIRGLRGQIGIFDRGAFDAEIGLDYDYGGALRLRLQHRLIQRFVPVPDHAFYLRLPASEAFGRKEDMFAEKVMEELVSRYDCELDARKEVLVLDARRQPEALAWHVLCAVIAGR